MQNSPPTKFLFNKVIGYRPAFVSTKRLRRRCHYLNFPTFLRTHFYRLPLSLLFYRFQLLTRKMGVSRKQSMLKFPKNKHLLPPDTHKHVCVSGGNKCLFFGNFYELYFLETPVLRFALLPYYRRWCIGKPHCRRMFFFRLHIPNWLQSIYPIVSEQMSEFFEFNCYF